MKMSNSPTRNSGKNPKVSTKVKKRNVTENRDLKLSIKGVENAYNDVIEDLNVSVKSRRKMTDEDMENLQAFIRTGDSHKLIAIKILIDNKVAEEFGLSESKFFRSKLGISNSVLSKSKVCIRVLKNIFGDDYKKYPIVSKNTLLALSKVFKWDENPKINKYLLRVWEAALLLSKPNKMVTVNNVKNASINVLPEDLFCKISEEIHKNKNTFEDKGWGDFENEPTYQVELKLNLGFEEFSLSDSKIEISRNNHISSMRESIVKIEKELSKSEKEMEESDTSSRFSKMISEQQARLDKLIEEYEADFNQLLKQHEDRHIGLINLLTLIEHRIDYVKKDSIRP